MHNDLPIYMGATHGVILPPSGNATLYGTCFDNDIPISGTFFSEGTHYSVGTYKAGLGPNGTIPAWLADIKNLENQPKEFDVGAVCLNKKILDLTVVQRKGSGVTVNAGEKKAVPPASCRSDEMAISGGFESPRYLLVPLRVMTSHTNQLNPNLPPFWSFEVKNDGSFAANFIPYVTCLKIDKPHLINVKQTVGLVQLGVRQNFTESCDAGFTPIGGGYKIERDGTILTYISEATISQDPRYFVTSFYNNGTGDDSVQIFTTCLNSSGITNDEKYQFSFLSQMFPSTPVLQLQDIIESAPHDEPERYYFLQFYSIPDSFARDSLIKDGVQLIEYIANHVYFAKSPVNVLKNETKFSNIYNFRAAFPITVDGKFEQDVKQRNIPPWAKSRIPLPPQATSSNENFAFDIRFHKDVSEHLMNQTIMSHGGKVVTINPLLSTSTTIMNFQQIENLAKESLVRSIHFVDPIIEPDMDRVRRVANVSTLQEGSFDLLGRDTRALVYDAWGVWDHPAYQDRLMYKAIEPDENREDEFPNHATFVAGILAGNGANSDSFSSTTVATQPAQFKGIAPETKFVSGYLQLWSGWGTPSFLFADYGQMVRDIQNTIRDYDVELITMSLGSKPNNSCLPFDKYHGNYSRTAEQLDSIVYGNVNGKKIIFTKSAGNERLRLSCFYTSGTTQTLPEYGSLSSPAPAKNPIVVGSIDTITEDVSNFSSFGPTDDGRIKPDIVAPGCHVWERGTDNVNGPIATTRDNGYAQAACGTSFSTPVVAGIVSLLLEQWDGQSGSNAPLPPSTAKAILIHTAADVGEPGPDYRYGWGKVNAQKAIELMNNPDKQLIIDTMLIGNQLAQRDYDSLGTGYPKFTLVWDDPPDSSGNERTLVNDIGMLVIDPDGREYRPFILDKTNPTAGASVGRDDVNNVEMIVGFAKAGTWKVELTANRIVSDQDYTLIISEESPSSARPLVNLVTLPLDGVDLKIIQKEITPSHTKIEFQSTNIENTTVDTAVIEVVWQFTGAMIDKKTFTINDLIPQEFSLLTVDEITTNTFDEIMIHVVSVDRSSGSLQPEICGDGIDNDNNGQIDEGCPTPAEICGDGIDNDNNGQIDEGCPSTPITTKLEYQPVLFRTLKVDSLSDSIIVKRLDDSNNPVTTSSLTVTLASSKSGTFRDVADSRTITSIIIPDGSDSASFKYRGTTAGSHVLTASSSGLISAQTTIEFGDCLIATAAFGSHLAKEVQQLREIRENVLYKTNSGTSFMNAFNAFYYTFSPTIAQWEYENYIFKEIVKTTITPLIMSLSILNHININSEAELLFYGINLILLNIVMYFAVPLFLIIKLHNSFKK